MPDFTVSLTTAQAQRVARAFSFLNATLTNPAGSPASAAQVQVWIKQQIRIAVAQKELQDAHSTAADQVETTLETEGWG